MGKIPRPVRAKDLYDIAKISKVKKIEDEKFWLGVGFVRPHIPFVAPKAYYEPYKPYENNYLPEKRPGDWDDIPKPGINYKTSVNMKMDERRQRKAIGGYYASVAYMDAQVGVVMKALDDAGLRDDTIVIFTSDHGYHLGEHQFWQKSNLHEEVTRVPMIIAAPGMTPSSSQSAVELIDIYPTLCSLLKLPTPQTVQGKDLVPLLKNPKAQVRTAALSMFRGSHSLRGDRWAYMRYSSGEEELYDMQNDPDQFINLVSNKEREQVKLRMREQLKTRRNEIK
jgi:iduronate 2-sulfatase